MKFKKTVEAHVEERVETSRVVCDGCGRDVDHADRVYHEEEAEISARIGDVYPEGSQQTAYDVDVCGECFLTKVVPALAAIGIKVRERDITDDEREWEPAS